jgi:membrane protease YdiL (CAAX protease family)
VPAIIAVVGVVVWLVVTRGAGSLEDMLKTQGQEELQRLFVAPATALAEVFVVGFSWLVIRLIVGRDWKRQLALRRPSLTHLLLAIVALPGMMILSDALYVVAEQLLPDFKEIGFPGLEEMMKEFSDWPLWFAILVVGVGPGVGEELWCRGFLGRGLVGRHGVLLGVLYTSFFFGVLHVDPPHAVTAAFMGLILHFTYLTTRSLWVPIILHLLNNSFAMVAISNEVRKPEALSVLEETSKQQPLPFVAVSIVLLLAASWALFRCRAQLVTEPASGEPESVPPDGITTASALTPDQPWQPPYPGVAYPPPESRTRVVQPWPHGVDVLLVVLAAALFMAVLVWGIHAG